MIKKGSIYIAKQVVQSQATKRFVQLPQSEIKVRFDITVRKDDNSCQGTNSVTWALSFQRHCCQLLFQELVYQPHWQMEDDLIIARQSLCSLFRVARAGRWV